MKGLYDSKKFQDEFGYEGLWAAHGEDWTAKDYALLDLSTRKQDFVESKEVAKKEEAEYMALQIIKKKYPRAYKKQGNFKDYD